MKLSITYFLSEYIALSSYNISLDAVGIALQNGDIIGSYSA